MWKKATVRTLLAEGKADREGYSNGTLAIFREDGRWVVIHCASGLMAMSVPTLSEGKERVARLEEMGMRREHWDCLANGIEPALTMPVSRLKAICLHGRFA